MTGKVGRLPTLSGSGRGPRVRLVTLHLTGERAVENSRCHEHTAAALPDLTLPGKWPKDEADFPTTVAPRNEFSWPVIALQPSQSDCNLTKNSYGEMESAHE